MKFVVLLIFPVLLYGGLYAVLKHRYSGSVYRLGENSILEPIDPFGREFNFDSRTVCVVVNAAFLPCRLIDRKLKQEELFVSQPERWHINIGLPF